MASTEALVALDFLAAGGFTMGENWMRAHDICQSHEGEALFDRIHALIHRIEGDDWNAGYWYRSAGVPRFEGTFAEEAQAIREAVAE